jgi:hypothetical protein
LLVLQSAIEPLRLALCSPAATMKNSRVTFVKSFSGLNDGRGAFAEGLPVLF